MRYAFTAPPGWGRAPFPPPQTGVYLRAPVAPGADSASILLLDSVLVVGSLADQLESFVKQSTDGIKAKAQKPVAVKSAAYSGLSVQLTAQVTATSGKSREEVRVYVMFDAGRERLPIAFVGGPKSLAAHQKVWDTFLSSIAPLDSTAPHRAWAE